MPSPITLARRAVSALTALNGVDGAATDTERTAMLAWPGWGPLAPAFDHRDDTAWAAIREQLDEIVDARAFAVAADIVDTSFYTSPAVVDAIFDLLRATGFTGGRVLEPGCGSGNFMSRTPRDLTIDWTGVELDPTAAAFARTLNPDATIHEAPLQKVSLRSGSFHAVVGNVPFARGHVYDSVHGSASSLHEYFFLRALDAVMPGGYVIGVTSRHLIDGEHGLDSIGAVADLVAAVRLPSDTFDGTSVVADIVILRKLSRDGKRTQSWTQPTHEVPVNSWSHSGSPRIAALPHTIVTGAHTTT